tara:strand:+ start:449 stop:805 length:357 start_codon:yes stop_codon:yes gene_type:complete
MIKISAEEINRSLYKAASVMRKQQEEINRLNEILQSKSRFEHAEKIASTAVERGFLNTDDAKDYASSLASSEKDLEIVEDFVSRTAMGVPLSAGIKKVAQDNGGTDILTTFLLTNDIP